MSPFESNPALEKMNKRAHASQSAHSISEQARRISEGERDSESRSGIRWLYQRNNLSKILLSVLTLGTAVTLYTGVFTKLSNSISNLASHYIYRLDQASEIEPQRKKNNINLDNVVSTNLYYTNGVSGNSK